MQTTRRKFITTSLKGAAILGMPTIIPASVFGANDKIRVAVIGINSRGKDHISGFTKLEKQDNEFNGAGTIKIVLLRAV